MSIEAIAWAFKQPIQKSSTKFVLIAIADNADAYGICFPSYKHIRKKTSLGRSTIAQCIKELVDNGIITLASRNRPEDNSQASNAYLLPIYKGDLSEHPLYALFAGGGPASGRGGPRLGRGGSSIQTPLTVNIIII